MMRGGPLSISEYMQDALTSPCGGYYMSRDVFGTAGDFTTSPEISQLFGEMLGIWCVHTWMSMGKPAKMSLVELGPGRGTLMADLLRGASSFRPFTASLHIHLVEVSPAMRKLQWEALRCTVDTASPHDHSHGHSGSTPPGSSPVSDSGSGSSGSGGSSGGGGSGGSGSVAQESSEVLDGSSSISSADSAPVVSNISSVAPALQGCSGYSDVKVTWHASIDSVPTAEPALYIAHEFFDALPVHQFVRDPARGWLEKMVDIDVDATSNTNTSFSASSSSSSSASGSSSFDSSSSGSGSSSNDSSSSGSSSEQDRARGEAAAAKDKGAAPTVVLQPGDEELRNALLGRAQQQNQDPDKAAAAAAASPIPPPRQKIVTGLDQVSQPLDLELQPLDLGLQPLVGSTLGSGTGTLRSSGSIPSAASKTVGSVGQNAQHVGSTASDASSNHSGGSSSNSSSSGSSGSSSAAGGSGSSIDAPSTGNGELVVLGGDEGSSSGLRFVLSPSATPATKLLLDRRLAGMEEEDIDNLKAIEVGGHSMAMAEKLALRIGGHGGAALIIDYGQAGPYSDSLVAIRDHQGVKVLDGPGSADLSAWVDFDALKVAAFLSGAPVVAAGPVTQAGFLLTMGIQERLQQLLAKASAEDKEVLASGVRRLLEEGPGGMGRSYKVMALLHNSLATQRPAGF
ncbi:MAG: hypothetical protein WDW36_004512 [Sanguina aurantia]